MQKKAFNNSLNTVILLLQVSTTSTQAAALAILDFFCGFAAGKLCMHFVHLDLGQEAYANGKTT
jgi:hypothetical protein